MVRFIPLFIYLFIYLYIYLLIPFFLEQKQANIALGQWGYEGVGGGGRQYSNIIDYTGMCLSEQGVKITHFLCPEEVTIPKQGLFPTHNP